MVAKLVWQLQENNEKLDWKDDLPCCTGWWTWLEGKYSNLHVVICEMQKCQVLQPSNLGMLSVTTIRPQEASVIYTIEKKDELKSSMCLPSRWRWRQGPAFSIQRNSRRLKSDTEVKARVCFFTFMTYQYYLQVEYMMHKQNLLHRNLVQYHGGKFIQCHKLHNNAYGWVCNEKNE